ncbi:LuxR C-terminal-related transcriptional regulator [uncultured Sphingomonas sp.]|uniref:LuxR C-terminal-related transcriptional regulator n=1 Tax=uncultured Sphingomonas sp. TaxID=158754 RepID=UPI0037489992
MLPDRFVKLTVRQRECLRLYHQRYRVKEIARMLAISENTASGYLTEATALLGVGGRPAAAAALAAFEVDHPKARGRFSVGNTTPPLTVLALAPAAEPTPPLPDHPEPRGRIEAGDEPAPSMPTQSPRRNPAAMTALDRSSHHLRWPTWLPLRHGDGNDLTIAQRFVWLGLLTFLLVSGFGIFAFFIRTASELVTAFHR